MIKNLWCWLTGHKFYLCAYVADGGMITIHRKDTMTLTTQLHKCSRCGYEEGEDADGLSWRGQLHYVQISEDVLKYCDNTPFKKQEKRNETK